MATATTDSSINGALPPEILGKIFDLCNQDELIKLMDVCQLWRNLLIDYFTNKMKCLEFNDAAQRIMKENDSVFRGVTEICVVISHPDITNLVALLARVERIVKLRVVYYKEDWINLDGTNVSGDVLSNITSLSNLTSFTFDGLRNAQHPMYVLDALLSVVLATSTDTLTHLSIDNSDHNLYDDKFNREFSGDLEFATVVAGVKTKVEQLIQACRQHLTHLTLNRSQYFSNRCKDIIPTISALEYLELGDASYADLLFVSNVKRQIAKLESSVSIHYLTLPPSADLGALRFLSHVDILDVKSTNLDHLRSLVRCLHSCSDLFVQQLTLTSRSDFDFMQWTLSQEYITNDMLLSFIQALPGLKKVDVEACQQLTNEGVKNVITSSSTLESINVSYITYELLHLLNDVVVDRAVRVAAHSTTLDQQLMTQLSPMSLYTGRNRNINVMLM